MRGQVDDLTQLVRQKVTIEGEPVLLLFTAADLEDVLAPLMLGVAIDLPPDQIDIPPLEPRAIVSMIRDRGLTGAAAPILGRRLHAIFGGRPGLVTQQLDTLVQEGWLDVTHTLTFANATRRAFERSDDPALVRLLFYAAHFVNRTRPLDLQVADRINPTTATTSSASVDEVVAAIAQQEVVQAVASAAAEKIR